MNRDIVTHNFLACIKCSVNMAEMVNTIIVSQNEKYFKYS